MLFNESSDLSKVFTELTPQWFEKISNETLRQLIYVILSWKEKITPPRNFPALIEEALKSPRDDQHRDRLQKLQQWHSNFVNEQMFHPFMSDIIGNTICADLLDYLPRDRMNLGMEPRRHTRLQRYFTIRPGTLYKDEGLRMSIMVTRRGRGGQKRDVATGVLDIMRERYEMAERVFYHHKKAAASAMLAKLVEIAGDRKPRDDGKLYPAPWEASPGELPEVPHMAHLSDSGIIDYLGRVEVAPEYKSLQHRLFAAIRFRRNDMYRTLLVIDHDVVNASSHTIDFFIDELRGSKGKPTNSGRRRLETILEDAARGKDSDDTQPGEVIIYCPSAEMQAKEVDARLEIIENSVLPLRRQRTQFVYNGDIKVLQEYYEDLWRAYILVSPELFKDATRCKALIDVFCDHFAISNKELVYRKVRTHNFTVPHEESSQKALGCFQDFVAALPFESVPVPVTNRLLGLVRHDGVFLKRTHADDDTRERLSKLLDVTILQLAIEDKDSARKLNSKQKKAVHAYSEELLADSKSSRISTQAGEWADFETYAEYVLASVIAPLEVAGKKN